MDHGFVGLIWGFCAAISQPGEEAPNTIKLGYQSEGQCIVRMVVGDSHGETITINEHAISVEILEGGAQVNIDEQGFVVIDAKEA